MKSCDYFEGKLIHVSHPAAIWQHDAKFLVTHHYPTLLRQWRCPDLENALQIAKHVRETLLPDASVLGAEKYPREYPLDVDWTRIR